jgi:hypothetical protein
VKVLQEAAGVLLDRQHGLRLTLRGVPEGKFGAAAELANTANM